LFYNIRGSKSGISHLVKEQWQGSVQTGTESFFFHQNRPIPVPEQTLNLFGSPSFVTSG